MASSVGSAPAMIVQPPSPLQEVGKYQIVPTSCRKMIDVRVRDPPDSRLAIKMQHSNLSHGGGEEVRCIQSGQEPRPKCPVEKHTQNVIPIEERACLQVPTELAARRGGALGVALPKV